MPRMIAHRPLTGDYGSVQPGETFDASEPVALHLEKKRLASRYVSPSVAPQIKMQPAVPENKALAGAPYNKSAASPVIPPVKRK